MSTSPAPRRRPSASPTTGGSSVGPASTDSGLTVHTGESGPVEEVARVVELLEPDRIGHGVKAAYDPRAMAMIRDRGIVLEICPTSNLNTRVVSGWDEFRWIFDTFRRNEVRFTISTDGPEMLKTYIRDEMAQLGRLGILSVADQEIVASTSLAASFVPNVSDVPAPRLEPASQASPSSAKRPESPARTRSLPHGDDGHRPAPPVDGSAPHLEPARCRAR